MKLDRETIDAWFAECKELSRFSRFIEKELRYKPHTLSDEEEKLVSKMQDCLGSHGDIRSIFSNSDLRFGKIKGEDGKSVELTDTNYGTFLMSADRRVRQAAFRTIYKTYEQFGNTYATLFNSRIKEHTTLAKIKNFKNSITSSTFSDEMDTLSDPVAAEEEEEDASSDR